MPPQPDPQSTPDASASPHAPQTDARRVRRWMRAIVPYAVAATASLIAAVVLLRLWDANLRVPLDYGGDALFFQMTVKAIAEQGWYLTNSRLGAPGVLTLHDFPLADGLPDLIIKVMSAFSADSALLFNLYFLAGFPLITMSALAVFRHFRIAYVPALAGSLLFAFLPRRLIIGQAHFHLDMYYQVPLAILVALWLCEDAPPLLRDRGPGRWPGLDLGRRRSIAALAIGVLTAATGLYFAFFAAALMVLGGAWAALRRRTLRNALAASLLAGVIVVVLAAQAAPTWLYQHRHGSNAYVAARTATEAEFYGMKITQLLLPTSGHRVAALDRLKRLYEMGTVPPTSESSTSSLGAVGSVGFLFLLAIALLGPRPDRPRDDLLRRLAVLNLLAVLIGTLGGFGALFAYLVTPSIRVYSRISVIIGFLSLFASALLIERLGAGRRIRTIALAATVLYLGLFDQGTTWAVRPYRDAAVIYRRDARFVARVEGVVPAAGMILQLPYLTFPEAEIAAGLRMLNYDPLRLYLHSRSARWSYPTMANRPGDLWTSRVSGQEPATMIATLTDAGFAGIVVDRYGYADDGAALEAEIGRILGVTPLVSEDARFAFFDLAPHARAALANVSAEERDRRRELVLHPVSLFWGEGFFGPEVDNNGPFRWSSGTGVIEIDNDSTATRPATLAMTFEAAWPPSVLTIESDLLSERIDIPASGAHVSRTLSVAPGRHVIRMHGDGRPAVTRSDPRTLIWRVDNLKLDDVPIH